MSSTPHHSLRSAGNTGANSSHHAATFRRRAGFIFVVLLAVVVFVNSRGSGSLDNSAVFAPASVVYDAKYDEAHADLGKTETYRSSSSLQRRLEKSAASSLEEMYCNMTNPLPGSKTPPDTRCLASDEGGIIRSAVDDAFVLVATVSEASLWDSATGRCNVQHLSWMGSVAIPVVVFVKSNATRSFRSSNNSWTSSNGLDARSHGRMHFPLLSVADGMAANQQLNTSAIFRSVLRDAWDAAQQSLPDEAPAAPLCLGSEWMTKKQQSMSDLFIFESPNVGDEALSIVEIALRMSQVTAVKLAGKTADEGRRVSDEERMKLMSLDSILSKAMYMIAVHDHADSWHSLRIVEQLRCLCMDQQGRYRTLTSPSKAYLLQCMPLEVNASDALIQVLSHVPPAAAKNPEFLAFHKKNIARSVALSASFDKAMRYLFTVDTNNKTTRSIAWPAAVVRDCCASFIVSRGAILGTDTNTGWPQLSGGNGVTAVQFWESLWKKVTRQPMDANQYFTLASVSTLHNSGGADEIRIGELSMYLERFWRTIFGATELETQRDVAVLHCADPVRDIKFDCPPFARITGTDGMLDDVIQGVASGQLQCDASFASRNVFRNPGK